ncbi:MAG: hypothetical protein ACLRQ4_11155, partial [Neglectibacter timonensis]
APPCQGGGSEFEPRRPLQESPKTADVFGLCCILLRTQRHALTKGIKKACGAYDAHRRLLN